MSFGMSANFNGKTPAPPKESDPDDLKPAPTQKQKKMRDPGPLARAIALSKRAKVSTYKNG